MRKYLFILLAAIASITYSACSDNDNGDERSKTYSNSYFSIQNGSFVNQSLPDVSDASAIQGLSINQSALTGGMNFATINTETAYDKFMVGVEGESGYWEINANETVQTGRSTMFTYIIPLNFGTRFSSDIVVVFIAVDNHGTTEVSHSTIKHVDSRSGDLNINLTFSNDKDIDLHLYTPSGKHIFFGNRGGSLAVSSDDDSDTIDVGLDHDSNATCYIDGLRNENIFIPESLVEDGEYRVVVDMYQNCTPSIPTSWMVVARYKGNIITPTFGSNPASGVYTADSKNGDMTTVMEFSINRSSRSGSVVSLWDRVNPYPLDEVSLMKLDNIAD